MFRTPFFSLPRALVGSLVGELRSHKPHGMAKKTKTKQNKKKPKKTKTNEQKKEAELRPGGHPTVLALLFLWFLRSACITMQAHLLIWLINSFMRKQIF